MTAYTRARTVLSDALAELAAAGSVKPNRVAVVTGEPAWDECCPGAGQLTVSLGRIYGSDEFPVDASQTSQAGCCPGITVAEMTLLLLRCAPSPDDQGHPPTPAALEAASSVAYAEAELLYAAVSRSLARMSVVGATDELATFNVAGARIVGPQGGCVGIQVDFLPGWVN